MRKKGKMNLNSGITLIALIITIIIMLILVAVVVDIAIGDELFDNAKTAVDETNRKVEHVQTRVDELMGELKEIEQSQLPTGWKKMNTPPQGWDTSKVTAITDGTNKVPLPKGYSISKKSGEQTVEGGLVIKDIHNNEFVWIPVSEDLANPYNLNSVCVEPKELTKKIYDTDLEYDSQGALNYLYGTKEDGQTPYFNYGEEFNYNREYSNMVTSVDRYHGFFVGRYQTTIDGKGNIGSVYNTPLLKASNIIKEGTNTNNNEPYYYRWYGLYYVQKNTDYIQGNGEIIQSAMIYGQLWDKMIEFFEEKGADYSRNTGCYQSVFR